jgi:hypothetical protein
MKNHRDGGGGGIQEMFCFVDVDFLVSRNLVAWISLKMREI